MKIIFNHVRISCSVGQVSVSYYEPGAHFAIIIMLGLQRTPEELETDLRPKNGQTRGYSGVGRQGHMFLLCYSPEGHKLLLDTRNNSGLLAIEIDKLHGRFY